jgi:hypothetical protein
VYVFYFQLSILSSERSAGLFGHSRHHGTAENGHQRFATLAIILPTARYFLPISYVIA